MKQSSIEWLEDNLKSLIAEDGAIYDFKLNVVELFKQAKKMHKQEIIEARLVPLNMFKELREKHGYFGGHDNGQVIDREINNSEYYYKITYEKEN